MKKTKIALTLVCAILLVAASVMGTLAYLTDKTATVTNTFTVGANVSITLDEAKVDDNGKIIPAGQTGTGRGTANEYKLLPGHEYDKDPTVHVTGESCYVFVTVDNDIAGVEAASTKGTIATQITNNKWVGVEGYTNLYVYVGDNTDGTPKAVSGSATASTDLVVFEKFKIDGTKTYNDLKGFDKTETTAGDITIKAYAIQSDGMSGKSAADIWALAKPNGAEDLSKPVVAPED